MKQVLQSLRNGKTTLADVPCPAPKDHELLIRTSRTLISAGTERMLIEFGKADPINKVRQQSDKVAQVLQKMKTDGIKPTIDAVLNKLDRPVPLGYCNVGRVLETGRQVGSAFEVGDRVISNGAHAEAVSISKTLCAKVPDNVSDDEAAFTVLGAIALQGIRLAKPTLGESFAVIGLGLIGLVTVQILRAQGCRVLGIDFDPARLEMAKRYGAKVCDLSAGGDPVKTAEQFSRGNGIDGVLITAATSSNEPVKHAADMSRKRGRIVLVGVAGLDLSRDDFFKKELSFQVSCSYGPGRYDPNYEDKAQDYPLPYVRWTEQRNFEAVLDMMASGALDVKPLISHRFAIEQAQDAYGLILSDEPSLGIVLDYPGDAQKSDDDIRQSEVELAVVKNAPAQKVSLGFVGAGNYASGVLIPAFKASGAGLQTISSSGGVNGVYAGKKFGFAKTTTEWETILQDEAVNAVVIATRHDTHANMVCKTLEAGKHVFVEKPLALSLEEIERIEKAHQANPSLHIMVGFNRRFSAHTQRIKKALAGYDNTPKSFVMSVNAGAIPSDHWTQDREIGGGRIIGEACHFIDLLRYLAGAPITDAMIQKMEAPDGDTATMSLSFVDGSIGTIHYFANGHKSLPKERLEVFYGGRVLSLDNFKVTTPYGWGGFRKFKTSSQDKGQKACAKEFISALENGCAQPIPLDEIFEVSKIVIQLEENKVPL